MASSCDGPVVTLINNRILSLRKELNRIAQLEESLAQGKSAIINKEQEELLKSKRTIVAAIDELEKFRQPLSASVDEEINRAIEASENIIGKEVDHGDLKTLDYEKNPKSNNSLQDLLSLIYLGSMFDLKSQNDFNSIILTRKHERNSCLMYDGMLGEKDLDLISMMGSLLISRPTNSSFSHQTALQRCIQHAKLWLSKSERPISSNSDVTYTAMREKLGKITGSDFLTITPEIKTTADVDFEAAGSNGFQVPVPVETSVPSQNYKMAGQVCEDLIIEIFTRLPVKSLVRFNLLSKSLSACIASPDFIRVHSFRSPQKILIRHKRGYASDNIPDFYTLHMKDQLPTDRRTGYQGIKSIAAPCHKYYKIVGSCNGIVCLYGNGTFILWNPSIGRKLTLSDSLGRHSSHFCWGCCKHFKVMMIRCRCELIGIGFGFDPITDDHKIVRLPKCGGTAENAYVYTMKTNAWCAITSSTPLFYEVTSRGCFINGSLHWVVQRHFPESDDVKHHCILTFDLSTHVFGKIALPKPRWETKHLTIIQGSLAVISSSDDYKCIWVMREYNNTDSWSVTFEYYDNGYGGEIICLEPASNTDLLLLNFYSSEQKVSVVYDPKVGAQSRLFKRYNNSHIADLETYAESLHLLHMETACQPSVRKEKKEIKRSEIQLKNSFRDLQSDEV